MIINRLINFFYFNPILARVFHSLVFCLRGEIDGYRSVLDLGCGSDSPVKYCRVGKSLGVDAYERAIEESRKKKIHDRYLLADISNLRFSPKSFDAVLLIEVLEHLPKNEGEELLGRVEAWARKKVIITSPNGFFPQKSRKNPHQIHRSGWTPWEMRKKGYRAYGLAGLKFLRKTHGFKENARNSLFLSIRFQPKIFWFIIAALSQIFTYYLPEVAFEVLYVKKIKR